MDDSDQRAFPLLPVTRNRAGGCVVALTDGAARAAGAAGAAARIGERDADGNDGREGGAQRATDGCGS